MDQPDERADLSCIVCDTKLKVYYRGQPIDGVSFVTSGHYGSKVFDPGDALEGVRLRVCVCDGCLRSKRQNIEGYVSTYGKATEYHHDLNQWDMFD